MSHARELLTYYPDPGIRRGPLRVLPRTDGVFIVVDERRPMGARTIAEAPRVEDAARIASQLATEEGIRT